MSRHWLIPAGLLKVEAVARVTPLAATSWALAVEVVAHVAPLADVS
jgi:hypothetical protein